MPHYKTNDNKIHFIESEEFENLLPFGALMISAEEADTLSNSTNQNVIVPSVVTRFQALAALHLAGSLDAVESIIQGADFLTQLAWKEAQSFERDSTMIAAIGSAVGLTDEDIDNLFISASKIK